MEHLKQTKGEDAQKPAPTYSPDQPVDSPEQPKTGQADQPSNKSKRWRILLLASILLAVAAGAYAVVAKPSQRVATPTPKPTVSNLAPSPAGSTGNVPAHLFHSNQLSQGVAIGYIKAKKISSRSHGLIGEAYADSSDYQPAIFYRSNDNQIYALNSSTKKTTQLTTAGGSHPVFASATQELAYKSGCNIVVKDLSDQSEITIQKGSTSETCYTPSNWSPNGKILAYSGTTAISNILA